MGKIIDRHRERVHKQSADWKDSRIVIATLAAAGTATFMSTVVLPITTSTLSAKLEALEPAAKKIQGLEKELDETKAALTAAKSLAAQAIEKTPFLPGSAYPAGLDRILIGSSQQEVAKAYPMGKWAEEDYVSTDVDHPIFGSVTYYFGGKKKNRNVTMILFHLKINSPMNIDSIKSRLTILYGPATAIGKRDQILWQATPRETVEIGSRTSYIVHPGRYIPYWANKRFNES